MSESENTSGSNNPQPSTQQTTQQTTTSGKPPVDYSVQRRFIGNSADKIRKKDKQ